MKRAEYLAALKLRFWRARQVDQARKRSREALREKISRWRRERV